MKKRDFNWDYILLGVFILIWLITAALLYLGGAYRFSWIFLEPYVYAENCVATPLGALADRVGDFVATLFLVWFLSIAAAALYFRRIDIRNRRKRIFYIAFIAFSSFCWIFLLFSYTSRDVMGDGANARRIADLRNAQYGLEYINKNIGGYPRMSGNTEMERWGQLEEIFKQEGLDIISEPYYGKGWRQYDYAPDCLSDECIGYVLSARLSCSFMNSSALKNDVDGIVYGIDCEDPVYCVQF